MITDLLNRPERDIKKAIIEYLKARGCLVIPYRTTGIKTEKRGWIPAPRRGISDLLGVGSDGRFFAIECKTRYGKATPEQEQFLESVRSFGCKGFIARSVEDVIKAGLSILITLSVAINAEAAPVKLVNVMKVAQIESNMNPRAYNMKSKASGLCQITPNGALADWNIMHPDQKYSPHDLFDGDTNLMIAEWYLIERIPQMLKRYRKPITVDNVLISYNAGVMFVVENRRLPKETYDYIRKYHDLVKFCSVEDSAHV